MNLQNEWNQAQLDDAKLEMVHRPIREEYSFYDAVKNGDLEFVRNNCNKRVFTNPEGMGLLSHNPLTNIKYHFVVTVALVARYCIEAGMELEQAYRLSDFYILKLDGCRTIDEIEELHTNMAFDYAGKMHLLKKDTVISKSISDCIDYIYANIQKKISLEDLAAHVNLSTSYLSRLFKQEIGVSISDYIREKKIEKAQNLLKYSNYSSIEIATHLSFSSQSHFIASFEKLVGLTPRKYREKYSRSSW